MHADMCLCEKERKEEREKKWKGRMVDFYKQEAVKVGVRVAPHDGDSQNELLNVRVSHGYMIRVQLDIYHVSVCQHPKQLVCDFPRQPATPGVVQGSKHWHSSRIYFLGPSRDVVDKEENSSRLCPSHILYATGLARLVAEQF